MSLLQMSFAGAVMILAIIVIRALAINLLPKKTFLVLWGIAVMRLVLPFSIPSAFSVYSLIGNHAPTVNPAKVPQAVGMLPTEIAGQMTVVPNSSSNTASSISMWVIVWTVGMETAGAKDMPEDVERKGLGTPATRAAVLEKLVSTGFVERKKAKKAVSLVPSGPGAALITVLPEQLQSPLLTAEWESRLKEIERGELAADAFMADISGMVRELVTTYTPVQGAEALFPSGRPMVGKCPRCGGDVTESKAGFFCESNACRFGLWKDNKYLSAKKITLTKRMASALLKDRRTFISGIYSEKTGKTYDAFLTLRDDGARTSFGIEFQ